MLPFKPFWGEAVEKSLWLIQHSHSKALTPPSSSPSPSLFFTFYLLTFPVSRINSHFCPCALVKHQFWIFNTRGIYSHSTVSTEGLRIIHSRWALVWVIPVRVRRHLTALSDNADTGNRPVALWWSWMPFTQFAQKKCRCLSGVRNCTNCLKYCLYKQPP